jgi:hypothetical protein
VTPLERLVTFITAQYRSGLHPAKIGVALILPVLALWAADRYVARRSMER